MTSSNFRTFFVFNFLSWIRNRIRTYWMRIRIQEEEWMRIRDPQPWLYPTKDSYEQAGVFSALSKF